MKLYGINWLISRTAGLLNSDIVPEACSGQTLSAEDTEDQVMGAQEDTVINDIGGLLSDIRGDLLYILQYKVRCNLLKQVHVQTMYTYRQTSALPMQDWEWNSQKPDGSSRSDFPSTIVGLLMKFLWGDLETYSSICHWIMLLWPLFVTFR